MGFQLSMISPISAGITFPLSIGDGASLFEGEAVCYGRELLKKIIAYVGSVFKALASIINNANLFGAALHVIKSISRTVQYSRLGQWDLHSDKLDKAIGIVSISRIVSDICYIATGEFISDCQRGRYGLAFGQISLGFSNALTTIMSIIKFMQHETFGRLDFKAGSTRALSFACDAFAIAGFIGHIGDAIHKLVREQGRDLQAWCDLAAAGFGICLPVATLVGVTSPPVLLALGLAACLCGIAAGILADYNGPLEVKASEDFAECSKDLTKVLGAFSSSVSLFVPFSDEESLIPIKEIASAAKAFCAFKKGADLINRGQEWFSVDADGRYFWEKRSIWKLGNKAFLTGKTLMDFYAFLDSMGSIPNESLLNKYIWKIPIFKSVKNLFALGAALLGLVDNAVKHIKLSPQHAILSFKQHKWNTIDDYLEDDFSIDKATAWTHVQQQLLFRYHLKIQKELTRGLLVDGDRIAIWQRHVDNLSIGQLSHFLDDKRALHLQKLRQCLSNCRSPEWQAAFQAEIDTIQQFTSYDFAQYRRSLADNRFNHSCAEKAKVERALISGVVKTILSLLSLLLDCLGDAVSASVAALPKYLAIVHKIASYAADVFVSLHFRLGEKLLILTSLPSSSVETLVLRRRLHYLPAA
jgi:hypothetical protein